MLAHATFVGKGTCGYRSKEEGKKKCSAAALNLSTQQEYGWCGSCVNIQALIWDKYPHNVNHQELAPFLDLVAMNSRIEYKNYRKLTDAVVKSILDQFKFE